jgi:hypothetical protein
MYSLRVFYMLPLQLLVPMFTGMNPAKVVGYFRAVKNPQCAFLRCGRKAVCPMPQICAI